MPTQGQVASSQRARGPVLPALHSWRSTGDRPGLNGTCSWGKGRGCPRGHTDNGPQHLRNVAVGSPSSRDGGGGLCPEGPTHSGPILFCAARWHLGCWWMELPWRLPRGLKSSHGALTAPHREDPTLSLLPLLPPRGSPKGIKMRRDKGFQLLKGTMWVGFFFSLNYCSFENYISVSRN